MSSKPLPRMPPTATNHHYRQPSPNPPPNRAPPPAPRDTDASLPPTPSKLQKHTEPRQPKPQLPLREASPARAPPPPPHHFVEPSSYGRPRGQSLASPPVLADAGQIRPVHSPVTSRPSSAHSNGENEKLTKKLRRRSWIPGAGRRSRNVSQDSEHGHGSNAWIQNGTGGTVDYSTAFLVGGEKVPELWDENADTFVYLFPRASERGPSFRIASMVLSSSRALMSLIHGESQVGRARARSFDGRPMLSVEDATRNLALRGVGTPPITPKPSMDNQSSSDGSAESIMSFADGPKEIHLYFPTGIMSTGLQLSKEDTQTLINIRNLFAFLTGQPLVETQQCATSFRLFLSIADLLQKFDFSNFDNSTYGESASTSFGFYLDELRLSDVRESREKTLEGMILGERMRSTDLYNEAYTHAVGKYSEVKECNPSLFQQLSQTTRARLERASMDLAQRQKSVELRLSTFEFPSLFAGIAASTSSAESKYINFKAWKSHFLVLRKHTITFYKDVHGQWPPKASSSKNQFTEGGLNRLVLKGLYTDFCNLYALLVDRNSITTRSYDAAEDAYDAANVDATHAALRRLLSEYDRSSPPVQPPIPFDVPKIPIMTTLEPRFVELAPKDQHKLSSRKLKEPEYMMLLLKSHNLDADIKTPFMAMYKDLELKEAKGKTAQELADMRFGHWIFMYAVLQSLPMLAVDAPGLRFSQGIEYFLSQPPLGNAPWMEDSSAVKKAWYGIQGGQGVVSLPSDVVNHGVEGIYRRSHCWTLAESWITAHENNIPAPAPMVPADEVLSPLAPPPGFAGAELGARPPSRGRQRGISLSAEDGLSPQDVEDRRSRSRTQRNSIALGLERLPIPAGHDEWSPAAPSPTMGSSSGGVSPAGVSSPGTRHMSAIERGGETPQSHHSRKGSTFDDILGGITAEASKPKQKTKAKKSFFS